MSSKRKRDPTFNMSEKMTLIDVVERHFDIVESKKTDTFSVRNKNDEWRQIAMEFNSTSSIHPREWTVLKNCWENLKKRAKQQLTQINQHFLGTGGGPPKKFEDDPAITRVLELIQTRVSGYVNCYDSDGTRILDTNSCASQLQSNEVQIATTCTETKSTLTQSLAQPEELVNTTCTETPNSTFTNWSQYTPSMLRDSRNPVLCPSPEVLVVDQQLSTQCDPLDATHDTIITPQRNNLNGAVASVTTSRRRPALRRERETQSLANERINTLLKANTQAEEQHHMNMRILHLQEQREEVMLEKEKEMLEQEKLKTQQECVKLELCQLELKKLKN